MQVSQVSIISSGSCSCHLVQASVYHIKALERDKGAPRLRIVLGELNLPLGYYICVAVKYDKPSRPRIPKRTTFSDFEQIWNPLETHVVPQSRDPTNSPCFRLGVELPFRLNRGREKLKDLIVSMRGVWGIDLHLLKRPIISTLHSNAHSLPLPWDTWNRRSQSGIIPDIRNALFANQTGILYPPNCGGECTADQRRRCVGVILGYYITRLTGYSFLVKLALQVNGSRPGVSRSLFKTTGVCRTVQSLPSIR